MPINNDEFRAALGRFASGVTVVTTRGADDAPFGITVSAFCSVSLEPPLVLVCIEKDVGSNRAVKENGFFVVNILGENQQYFSDRFASKLPDKFSGVDFRENAKGIPVLADTLVSMECRLVSAYESGDHTIFVGEVESSSVKEGNPLVYFHGNYHKIEN